MTEQRSDSVSGTAEPTSSPRGHPASHGTILPTHSHDLRQHHPHHQSSKTGKKEELTWAGKAQEINCLRIGAYLPPKALPIRPVDTDETQEWTAMFRWRKSRKANLLSKGRPRQEWKKITIERLRSSFL